MARLDIIFPLSIANKFVNVKSFIIFCRFSYSRLFSIINTLFGIKSLIFFLYATVRCMVTTAAMQ